MIRRKNPYRFARKDSNHESIKLALRQCGCLVMDTSNMGDGYPDLTCLFRDRLLLFEVKSSPKAKLTPAEAKFHREWTGAPIHIVRSIDDAIEVLNGIE